MIPKRYIKSMILPVLFIIIWQMLSISIDNAIILPRVDSITELLIRPTQDLLSIGSLIDNTIISVIRVIIGYIIASIVAITLGMIIGYSHKLDEFLLPFLSIFRPIAPLAWVPLVLAWFGVSSLATITGVEQGSLYIQLNNIKLSMLFIIFIGAFFPILTNTIYGVKSVKKTLIDSALTLGANRKQIFTKVLLPASLPSIVTGLRIGLGVAWMCLVSAEMLPGSLSGIGYLITHAYTVARTDVVIAGMISISLVGGFLEFTFQKIENKFFKWQRMER
ncbi:ABC transporter permease [Senegalia massiliensis]|uniref:ABC transporter permease n=1 Tax=Senegalia massiliensis TaxID=1720316 RepID=A0A845R0W1_9CLOT|nr:ABC transporter permease [Senegalia massiliensis]NBI07072.1 ABC transporter permease [Senegalia massiliensis]